MKKLRIFFKLLLGFCIAQVLVGQTYQVGDFVEDFSSPICANGNDYWSYEAEGRNKVICINLFTSW